MRCGYCAPNQRPVSHAAYCFSERYDDSASFAAFEKSDAQLSSPGCGKDIDIESLRLENLNLEVSLVRFRKSSNQTVFMIHEDSFIRFIRFIHTVFRFRFAIHDIGFYLKSFFPEK